MEFRENVPLAPMTTFEIGGPARWYAEVCDLVQLKEALSFAQKNKLEIFVMGGGSNVLVSDDGFPGLVIKVAGTASEIDGTRLVSEGGANLETLIRQTAAQGLQGWEELAGIPGTVGGAVRGNAGAFGVEMKDVIESVTAFNLSTHSSEIFGNKECQFAYRHSYFKDKPELVIMKVTLQLKPGDVSESNYRIDNTIEERNRRHLQNVRAAGSFFMNPVAPRSIQEQFEEEKKMASKQGRVPAGWLIEKVGLKGFIFGGAQASIQHPNYLVDLHEATARDVLMLAGKVRAAVRDRFGITLEEEVTILA
jgi:UDP-N-acetylmuramate dehydrogenase